MVLSQTIYGVRCVVVCCSVSQYLASCVAGVLQVCCRCVAGMFQVCCTHLGLASLKQYTACDGVAKRLM